MKKIKIVSVLFCLLFSLAAFGGCGDGGKENADSGENGGMGSTDTGGKKKLVFMGWTNATEKRAYEKAIEQFEKQYDCEVTYIPVGVNEYRPKLLSMLSADALNGECSVDVFYVPSGMLWNFAMSGHVEDLQPYVDSDENFHMEDYWYDAGYYQYILDGDQVGQGHLYAFPKDVGPWGLVYNKTLFAQYNIEAPTPENPWTWEELVEIGKRMDNRIENPDAKRDTWLLGGADLKQVIYSYDASWLTEDRKQVAIDRPEFIQALEMICTMIEEGTTPNQDEVSALDPYTRWVNGKIGIYYGGPWDITTYTDYLNFEWDYLPLIAGPAGTQATTWGYMGLAVSSRSADKQLAYELAKFLSTDEDCQRTLYKMGQTVPNIISMAKGEFIDYHKDAQPGVGEWIDILERTGRPEETHLTPTDAWMEPFEAKVGLVFSGEMTVEAFIEEVEPEMQAALDTGWREMEELKESVGWKKTDEKESREN